MSEDYQEIDETYRREDKIIGAISMFMSSSMFLIGLGLILYLIVVGKYAKAVFFFIVPFVSVIAFLVALKMYADPNWWRVTVEDTEA